MSRLSRLLSSLSEKAPVAGSDLLRRRKSLEGAKLFKDTFAEPAGSVDKPDFWGLLISNDGVGSHF